MGRKERRERISSLNDDLRCRHTGGQIVTTSGINALGQAAVDRILEAVAGFTDFSADNDPHGEHDCAVQAVEGQSIIWKIDYYDRAFKYGSEDPADPEQTSRVLTIMLAEEY